MSHDIVVSLIGLFGSAIGTLGGILVTNKLTNYRLEQLEKKVDKHNNLIERTYKLEERISVIENREKVSEHRIEDLERKE